jgi:hypothetical protein
MPHVLASLLHTRLTHQLVLSSTNAQSCAATAECVLPLVHFFLSQPPSCIHPSPSSLATNTLNVLPSSAVSILLVPWTRFLLYHLGRQASRAPLKCPGSFFPTGLPSFSRFLLHTFLTSLPRSRFPPMNIEPHHKSFTETSSHCTIVHSCSKVGKSRPKCSSPPSKLGYRPSPSSPPPPTLYTATGMSARPTPLDGLTLACSLRSRSPLPPSAHPSRAPHRLWPNLSSPSRAKRSLRRPQTRGICLPAT